MMTSSTDRRLGLHYGAMSLYTAMLHNLFLLYHVDVFVSVYKIDKLSFWIGEGIFLVWNSLNDPLFGWISDRRHLGKQRDTKTAHYNSADNTSIVFAHLSSLKKYGPAFALSFLAFWTSWTFPSLQFVLCLCAYDAFLTMIDLHHKALLADLSFSAHVRTQLNMYCSIGGALGSATVFISYVIWSRDFLAPFRWLCVALSVAAALGFVISARALGRCYEQQQRLERERGGRVGSGSAAGSCEITSEFSSFYKRHLNSGDEGGGGEREGGDDEGGLWEEKAALKKFIHDLAGHKNFLCFTAMNIVQVGISFLAPHVNNLYFLTLCRRYGAYRVIRFLFMLKLALGLAMLLAHPGEVWLLGLFIASNRVFTEGTCKLLNLVIADLVDEDVVLHNRTQSVSTLMFGTIALLSKPGQTIAPLLGTWLLAFSTGHDVFASTAVVTSSEFAVDAGSVGSLKLNLDGMSAEDKDLYQLGVFHLLIYTPIICALLQLLAWSRFSLHGKRLQFVKSMRDGLTHVIV